jgi:DNA-binding transcriptional LysR family regulator
MSSLALLAAARAGAGIAILPRYLGDAETMLRHIEMAEEPTEPIWITMHRDMKKTPRVRAVVDFLVETIKKDAGVLRGR